MMVRAPGWAASWAGTRGASSDAQSSSESAERRRCIGVFPLVLLEADVDGVAEQQELALRVAHFGAQPVTGSVESPLQVEGLIGGCDGLLRQCRRFLAVEEQAE